MHVSIKTTVNNFERTLPLPFKFLIWTNSKFWLPKDSAMQFSSGVTLKAARPVEV
uniref:Uncharacterized protein n=1 Tax=Rhizophora mucronata TaxID=61149 RepID=A0A2P2M200_RHIMU